MFKKYWLVDSDQSIVESIGQATFNTPIEMIPQPFEVLQDGGDVYLIDTTESPTPHQEVMLQYINQALEVIQVPSANFLGVRPHKPK